MEKLLQAAGRNPAMSVIAVFILLTACLPGLFQLKSDPGFDGFFYVSDANEIQAYQQIVERFGHESVALLVIENEKLLSQESLNKLGSLKDKIDSLNGISKVRSLFDIPVIHERRIKPFGGLHNDLEVNEMKDLLKNSSGFAKHFLSEDHNTTLFVIEFESSDRSSQNLFQFGKQLESIIEEEQPTFSRIYQLGEPYYMLLQDNVRIQDGMRLIPASIIGLLLLITVGLRDVRATLLPLTTGAASLVGAFGFMGWMGYPLTVFTFSIPVTLLLIGSTEDIFLINEYRRQLSKQASRKEAFNAMAAIMGRPIFATAASTIMGFTVVAFSPVPIVREFGLTMAVGLTVNFIATFLLAPVALKLIRPEKNGITNDSGLLHKVMGELSAHFIKCRKTYLGLMMVIVILSMISLPRIRVNNSFFEFYGDDSEMESNIEHYSSKFEGPLFFNITLTPETGNFQNPANLSIAENVRRKLETSFSDITISSLTANLGSFLEMRGQGPNPDMPESPKTLRSYLSLLIRGDASNFNSLSTKNFEQLRFIVQHKISSSAALRDLIRDIDTELSEALPDGWKFTIAGQYNLISGGLDAATWNTMESFPWVVVFSAIAIMYIIHSVRLGIIVLIPSTLAVLLIGCLCSTFDVSINIATGMIPVITLALAVDHAIHLTNHATSSNHSILNVLMTNFTPIAISFCGMCLCFGIISLSAFGPIASFGRLTLAGQILSMLFALMILPVAFRSWKNQSNSLGSPN